MPSLDLGDAVINYEQNGRGPDIFWVPGGDSTVRDYDGQYPFFAPRFRNTAVDPRGAGLTVVRKAPPWTIKDMAADCAAVIRAVCQPPVFVCGLSMGGLITQQIAIDYPELVRAAIPMGTTAKPTGYCRDFMVADVEFRKAGGRMSPALAATHYGALLYPAEVLGDEVLWPRIYQAMLEAFTARDSEHLIAQWQACIDFDCEEGLRTCPVPMHVIAFSEDLQTPPSYGRRVAELAPKGHFHLLQGLGHASMMMHREREVNEAILAILQGYV